jgi:hypothetical protein
MVTRPNSDKREYALTILARMIVRAYLGEIDRGEAGPNAYRDDLSVRNDATEFHDDCQKLSSDTD